MADHRRHREPAGSHLLAAAHQAWADHQDEAARRAWAWVLQDPVPCHHRKAARRAWAAHQDEAHRRWAAHRDEDQARDEARSPSRSPYAPRTLQARDEASSPYTSPYTLQAGPAPCRRRAALALRA